MVGRDDCVLLDTVYDSQGSAGSSLCGWDGLENQGMPSFQQNKLAVSTPKTRDPLPTASSPSPYPLDILSSDGANVCQQKFLMWTLLPWVWDVSQPWSRDPPITVAAHWTEVRAPWAWIFQLYVWAPSLYGEWLLLSPLTYISWSWGKKHRMLSLKSNPEVITLLGITTF